MRNGVRSRIFPSCLEKDLYERRRATGRKVVVSAGSVLFCYLFLILFFILAIFEDGNTVREGA